MRIDIEDMVIHVRRSAKQEHTKNGWMMTLGSPKTASGRRDVMIPAQLKEDIRARLESVPKEPTALVFAAKGGRIMQFSQLEELWARARMTVPRLAHMHYHDLRHTALTHLAQHGATVAELEQIAGHADARTAMHYQHAVDEHERRVINETAEKPTQKKIAEALTSMTDQEKEKLIKLLIKK